MAYLKRMLQVNGRSYASIGASSARVILPMTDSYVLHRSLYEQKVLLLLSRPLQAIAANRRLRNFDVFELLLNHMCASGELQ